MPLTNEMHLAEEKNKQTKIIMYELRRENFFSATFHAKNVSNFRDMNFIVKCEPTLVAQPKRITTAPKMSKYSPDL